MSDPLLTSKKRLQEAESLIAMLSTDMAKHDFTYQYLPHWRARLHAFLEHKPATYNPKDAPPLARETCREWQPVESFDFEQGFAQSRWVLVHTSDGRVTEGTPFIMDGDKRLWICACGSNAHDPRYVPSPSCLRDTVTHWMPKPEPPSNAQKTQVRHVLPTIEKAP